MRRHQLMNLTPGVLFIALASAACVGTDRSLPTTGPVAQSGRTVDWVGQGFDLVGTVNVIDGCLVVERKGSGAVVPVFAAGNTEWTEGTLRWAGDSYKSGDSIAVQGGPAAGFVQLESEKYIPNGCEGIPRFYLDWLEGDQQFFSDGKAFPPVK